MKLSRRARKRIRQLTRMIDTYQHQRVSWWQERAYVERTGRLDWVDPNPLKVHPASTPMKPPPMPR